MMMYSGKTLLNRLSAVELFGWFGVGFFLQKIDNHKSAGQALRRDEWLWQWGVTTAFRRDAQLKLISLSDLNKQQFLFHMTEWMVLFHLRYKPSIFSLLSWSNWEAQNPQCAFLQRFKGLCTVQTNLQGSFLFVHRKNFTVSYWLQSLSEHQGHPKIPLVEAQWILT